MSEFNPEEFAKIRSNPTRDNPARYQDFPEGKGPQIEQSLGDAPVVRIPPHATYIVDPSFTAGDNLLPGLLLPQQTGK
jgi:hypothetical protein